MNISFKWNDDKINSEQKERVEENIREEMPNLLERFPEHPSELVVSLFSNQFLPSLEGSAATAAGETLVKITYSLVHPCQRDYFYLGHSRSNEG